MNYDRETGQILEIYQPLTGATDAIAIQHDVDYGVCSNRSKNTKQKLQAQSGQKMVKALDAVLFKQRQWGHAAARNTINLKQKLGLGLK